MPALVATSGAANSATSCTTTCGVHCSTISKRSFRRGSSSTRTKSSVNTNGRTCEGGSEAAICRTRRANGSTVSMCRPDAERREAFRLRFARDRVRPTRTPHRAPPRPGHVQEAASADSDLPTVYRSAARASPQATQARSGVAAPCQTAQPVDDLTFRASLARRASTSSRRWLTRRRKKARPSRRPTTTASSSRKNLLYTNYFSAAREWRRNAPT